MDEIKNKKEKCIIVIPSRLNSSRLPEKALLHIDGKPLIQRVVEIAKRVRGIDEVVVATDSQEIAEAGKVSGAEIIITTTKPRNGTERLIEVMKKKNANYYINLQGDEPLIDNLEIEEALNTLKTTDNEIVTICRPISIKEAKNPSRVKVIMSDKNKAIYFSRAIIPHNTENLLEHSGVYLFKKNILSKIEKLKPTNLENIESLEQLRWLEAGLSIHISLSNRKSISIDTFNDIIDAERLIKIRKIKTIILDVDGVLTNGKIFYGNDGEEYKEFSTQDGSAIKRLQNQGYIFAILSGKDSKALRKRASDLNINNMILGVKDKSIGIKSIQKNMNIEKEKCAYVGDDIDDIYAMKSCGWNFAVKNAREEVKHYANEIINKGGGEGAIAELESILNKINGITNI